MNSGFEVLIIGDSSLNSFVSWRLSSIGVKVTYISSFLSPEVTIHWKSTLYGEKSYNPFLIKNSLNHLFEGKQHSSAPITNLDFKYIFISSSSTRIFKNTIKSLKKNLDLDNSIILIDSSFSIFLESFFYKKTSNLKIFLIYSNIDARYLNNSNYLLADNIDESIQIAIGLVQISKCYCYEIPVSSASLLESDSNANDLDIIIHTLNTSLASNQNTSPYNPVKYNEILTSAKLGEETFLECTTNRYGDIDSSYRISQTTEKDKKM
ncbi:Osw2p ASCRUDRAFT_139425 [Ascoidea rubescens DSM 1968]|uniref:Ketopantoate reductase N-terminal domain-containing protein n=1 Tax=Ascoidea rubescens DSM 1968 TaxID=1344418 RepID=A0A1D2VK31_9ASCO|nr:hypothetical protein ASCRUDRAFT_139425 [Ascoidea rubescens DSM 1968]ODV61949.1 hypothetical protein ASCRUDRAFT_139425 [Ascoidea rubescens DSM 1968]